MKLGKIYILLYRCHKCQGLSKQKEEEEKDMCFKKDRREERTFLFRQQYYLCHGILRIVSQKHRFFMCNKSLNKAFIIGKYV